MIGFLPVLVEEPRAERLGVESPELEDVTDLDRRLHDEAAAAHGTGVALPRLADVRERRLEVAPGLNAAQVPTVAVRAGDELALAQRLVRDHLEVRANRPEEPARVERGTDLLVRRRPERRLEQRLQLLLAQPVVPADESEHEPVASRDRHRLRRRRRVDA